MTNNLPSQNHPLVVAITGASGAIYAARLLDVLSRRGVATHVTISTSGRTVIEHELGVAVNLNRFDPNELLDKAVALCEPDREAASIERPGAILHHHHADFMAPIASGSFLTGGMAICPCSGGTLSGVVHGSSTNLIQRAADCHLKERRPLVLVPRATPLSLVQLDNMRRAAELGAVVLPASPGWYHGVASLGDLVDFVVARVLDQLGVENHLMQRWGEQNPSLDSQDGSR
jgi:flavin prenyltransferase